MGKRRRGTRTHPFRSWEEDTRKVDERRPRRWNDSLHSEQGSTKIEKVSPGSLARQLGSGGVRIGEGVRRGDDRVEGLMGFWVTELNVTVSDVVVAIDGQGRERGEGSRGVPTDKSGYETWP